MRLIVELKSGRGRQSIRVDCGPAGGKLDQTDIAEDDDDDADRNNDDDEVGGTSTTWPTSDDEVTDWTDHRTVTSATWNSMTSLIPAAETTVAMTTASVTSSHHVTSDHSSSSSVNVSCE